ncbi:hypothetical protein ACX0HA_01505 [Flavobacterium hauense]
MKNHTLFKLLIVMGLLSSCSTIHEVHYFKDKITSTKVSTKVIPNYYKVEINGCSFFSSSRYISGYFDQSAINLYFNEFTQPENGKLFGTEASSSAFTDEQGNELVLIFSTNAKAVTDQIGAVAKNQVVLNSAASILQKDKVEEAEKIKLNLDAIISDKDIFILENDLYLKDIAEKSESEKKLAIKQLLEIINK